MKRAVLLSTTLCMLAALSFAAAPSGVHTYWERLLGMNTAEDTFRDIAVSADNEYLVTIDRANTALTVYEAEPGLPHVRLKDMSTSGITVANYAVNNIDFSEDGALFGVSLSVVAGYHVYYWPNIDADPIEITTGSAPTDRMGDAIDVQGRVDDNTVEVLVAGNNAATNPIRYTTTDNGATWTATDLGTPIQLLDVDLVSGGGFWGVGAGVIQAYDNTGTPTGVSLTGHAAFAVGVDEANGLVYTMGIRGDAVLKVWDASDGSLIHTDTNVIDGNGTGAGVFGGFANGSASVRVVETVSGSPTIYVSTERNGFARLAHGSEIVVDGVGAAYPAYATINDAILSYASGGENTTATTPLIISIDAAGGPYDEALDMDASIAGNGDFPGDLVVRGINGRPHILLQNGSSDDGLVIWQETNEIHFENLLFAPSLTATTFGDELIRLDETNTNTDFNWISFKDVILTEIDSLGNPLMTDRSQVYDPLPATPGSARNNTFASLFQWWGDGGEAQNVWMELCTLYGNTDPDGPGSITQSALRVNLSNANERGYFHNVAISQTELGLGARFSSSGTADSAPGYIRWSGDDIRGSVDEKSILYNASAGPAFANMWIQDALSIEINNTEFYSDVAGAGTGGGNYGVDIANAGIDAYLYQLDDCTFNMNSVALQVPTISSGVAHTYHRNTFHTEGGTAVVNNAGAAAGTLTFVDSIFSGAGATIGGSGFAADYSGFATSGPDALASKGTIADTNSVNASPVYVSKDPSTADFLDVQNGRYASANSTGGDLEGGADFVGGVFTGSLVITEIMDGQTSGTGFHRYAEITNVGDAAADLSEVAFANANNGGTTFVGVGTDLATATGIPSLAPGASIVLTNDSADFATIYGFAADAQLGSLNVNGDDVLAIVQFNTQNPMDVYGVLGVDGTGEIWEYQDTRVRRLPGASANLGTFDDTDWVIASIDDLDNNLDGTHARIGNPGFFDNNMVIATQIGVGTDLDALTTPALSFAPSAADLINGETFVAAGVPYIGLHGAATGGVAVFTDGVDVDTNDLDGLLNDANGLGEPTRLELDWSTSLGGVRVDQINTWSRNNGLDARVFINLHIYLDTTDDATFNPTFYGEAITGGKGASNTTNNWSALYVTDSRGSLVDGAPVYGVALDFYSVTDAGSGFRFEGKAAGGSIIKEIDILGAAAPSGFSDWTVFE